MKRLLNRRHPRPRFGMVDPSRHRPVRPGRWGAEGPSTLNPTNSPIRWLPDPSTGRSGRGGAIPPAPGLDQPLQLAPGRLVEAESASVAPGLAGVLLAEDLAQRLGELAVVLHPLARRHL